MNLTINTGWRPLSRLALILLLAGMVSACVTNPALDKARQQIADGDSEGGLATLQVGMKAQPEDQELRTSYHREKDRFLARLLMTADSARLAGRWGEATAGYERVLRLDPANARATAGKGHIALDQRHQALLAEALSLVQAGDPAAAEARLHAILMENPQQAAARSLLRRIQEKSLAAETQSPILKSALTQTITLEFRDASLKSVFEVIARTSGLNFVFDRDVKGDTPVTLFVRDTKIEEVMKLLLVTNQLERKVLNENTVLIYPNTPVKAKDYQELVVRSFYLKNAEVKQAMALIKTMVKTRDVFADEKLNLLVMRDTPDAVRMAERLIDGLDLAEPEVMLEVEVLEVARNKLQNLGVQWPDQVGYGRLTPDVTNSTATATGVVGTATTLGGALATGYTSLRSSLGVPFVANPAFMLNLHDGVDNADILANPRIRVKNKEKAKIHIGERLPVFTTTSTANVGVSSSVNYLDVGLKLDVEPSVGLDDDVSIKVGLEVSNVIKEVIGPQSSLAYDVGTRTASTTLRLKDGETQVLAGLINDEERSSALRLPGLGDMPVLGRLFGSKKDSRNKTEIVLLITPHIVRNVAPPDASTVNFAGGTDASVGTPPLRMTPGKSGSLSMSSIGSSSGFNALPSTPAAPATPTPFVPPENGSPQPPAAAPQAAPAMAGQARVQFQVPAKAVAGQDMVLGLSVSGLKGLSGGQVEVAYDPTAVEIPGGAADGRLVFSLAVQGDGLHGEGRVRVIPGSGKEVAFQVVSIQVDDASGTRTSVPPPPPSLVKIVQ